MNSEKKVGALLLYLTTILNLIVSIFLTPLILGALGDTEYGIYRSISALTGQLALVSIGIGTITSVFVARYNARNDENACIERENFLSMAITASAVISVLVLAIGCVLYLGIDDLYRNTLNESQISLTKTLYIILVINVSLHLFRDVFVGIVNGYEKFTYGNGIKVIRIILRVVIIVVLIKFGFKSIGLVFCDLIVSLTMIICDLLFCFGILKVKIKYHYFDKALFKTMFTFSLAIFMQAIVNQVNQNLDSVILGAMIAPERVTIYSLALTIYVAFNSLSSSISSLYTPEAARLVQNNADKDCLMNFTIKVGRVQLLVIFLILGGFIALGREFVSIWAGQGKGDIYYLTLILMIPMSIANLLSGANSVLDGYMKRMGRSIILIIMAVYNVASSIIMIHYIDYWGAAIGTATSVILGQIIMMGAYYKKIFGFDMLQFLKKTLKGILSSMILAVLLSMPIGYLHISNIAQFVLKGIVFVLFYFAFLLLWGMNKSETASIKASLTWLKK